MKKIDIQGMINFIELDGSDEWYWAMDHTGGDLYEAEELFKSGHEISCNKLVFVKYPSGEVFEPINPERGQYFGRPIYYENEIVILLVNFIEGKIKIISYKNDFKVSNIIAIIPLSEVTDCYNLRLEKSPLILIRSGYDNMFDMIYPEKIKFPITSHEGFEYIAKDKVYFGTWYEDPDYREEVIVRDIVTGEIIETFKGSIRIMPNGDKWLLN